MAPSAGNRQLALIVALGALGANSAAEELRGLVGAVVAFSSPLSCNLNPCTRLVRPTGREGRGGLSPLAAIAMGGGGGAAGAVALLLSGLVPLWWLFTLAAVGADGDTFFSPPKGRARDDDCKGAAGGLVQDGGGGGGGRLLVAPVAPVLVEEGKEVGGALASISGGFFKIFVVMFVLATPLPFTLSADLLAEGMGPREDEVSSRLSSKAWEQGGRR